MRERPWRYGMIPLTTVACTALGCVNVTTPLDLTSLDPATDQRKIADYHRQDALFFRLKARELAERIVAYRGFFGTDSDLYDIRWQSYTENVDALSADDLQVLVKAAIILRPIPEEVYFLAHEVGMDFYLRIVKPEFLAAVRSVVSSYSMVTVPEKSSEIASKVQAVVVEKLKGRHLAIQSVALADVDFPQIVLSAIEQKQAKEQEKEQKEFELTIASKDADIARTRAKGEGDSIRIRAEGEAEGLRIRAIGQAKSQEAISKTLTPDYLRYKLYDSQNSKLVLLPDKLNVPILLNPGSDEPRHLSQDTLTPSEQKLSGR